MATAHKKEVLQLDKTYNLIGWMSFEDAIMAEAKDNVLDHLGEEIKIYHGGTNKQGVQSSLATSTIIVVDGLPNQKRSFRHPVLTNGALFQRDRYVCAYCGGLFKDLLLTRDHVHPVSKGGQDKWMNVVTACKACNNLKGDLVPGEKLAGRQYGPQGNGLMEPLYVPYVPCRAEALLMKNRAIKFDQMAFLLERIQNKEQSRIYRDYKVKLDAHVAATGGAQQVMAV